MTERSTTVRDKHRKILRAQGGPCGLCRKAIDYDLPHSHPMSFQAHHVIPLNRGGQDVLENKVSSHRTCNRRQSDRLPGEERASDVKLPLITSRDW